MTRIFALFVILLITILSIAQTPEKISYQAIIRDSGNNLVTLQQVGMRISILQGSANGTPYYTEEHTATTNINGLVSIEIGTGQIVQGTIEDINWPNGPYFIKTETDPSGGNHYSIIGTSQLLTVPYAMHAKSAGRIVGVLPELDPVYGVSVASKISEADTASWNSRLKVEIDGDPNNEIQVLSIRNDTIFLQNGGFVKLPPGFDGKFTSLSNIPENLDVDATDDFDGQFNSLSGQPVNVSHFINDAAYLTEEIDGSISNEIQDLQLLENKLFITNNEAATNIDLSPYLDDTDTNTQLSEAEVDAMVENNGYLNSEVDGSISNEIQDLELNGNTLSITNNETATSIDLSPYMDDTDTNTQLSETEVDAMVANNGYLTSELDGSTSNEIQDLKLTGNTLSITNNGAATSIDLSPYLDDTDTQLSEAEVDAMVANNGYLSSEVDGSRTNEIQTLSIAGNIISLSRSGGSVNLPASTTSLDDAYDNGRTITANAGAVTIAGTDGIVSTGTLGSGASLSVSGAGTRMFWYPESSAFRAGTVNGAQWDLASIADYSTAFGYNTTASNRSSFAIGEGTSTTGIAAVAMGKNSSASAEAAVAMGENSSASDWCAIAAGYEVTASHFAAIALGYKTTASGNSSTALGYQTVASGFASTAIGETSTASGSYSTTLGNYVSTNSQLGSFIIGDRSTFTTTSNDATNQMVMRFAGGYKFYSSSNLLAGVTLAAGGGSWASVSDSTKKENYLAVNGEYFLNSLAKLKLGSWNYIGQEAAQYRHYGPMAQEIFKYFGKDELGTIGCDTLLASADMDGIMMICLQALEKRTSDLKIKEEELQKAKQRITELEKRFAIIEEKLGKIVNTK